MTSPAATLLWLGDASFRDFQKLPHAVPREVQFVVASIDEFPQDLAPDWVAVAVPWPGAVAHAQLDAVRAQFPLTPLILVLGSWCEGEFRSGDPYPEAPRVYWHQFASWFRGEVARFRQGRGLPQLPPTASAAQRWLASVPELSGTGSGLLHIRGSDLALRQLLADACQRMGFDVHALKEDEEQEHVEKLVLWCLADDTPQERHLLAVWIRQHPAATVIVVLGFPRSDTLRDLKSLGVRGFVSQPFDLFAVQDQLTRVAFSMQ